MTVVGVTMVKDEEDVIGTVLRHTVTQVDAIVIADNMSTDRTREIIGDVMDEADIPMWCVDDMDPAHDQSRKMTALAHVAGEKYDADWIVPFDADEIWVTASGATINDWLHGQPGPIVNAHLYDHIATAIDDPDITDPIHRMQWCSRFAGHLPKVAARYSADMVIENGNHGVHYLPEQCDIRPHDDGLLVHHFPYRTPEQMIRKVRNGAVAIAAADLPDYIGAHWRKWGYLLEWGGEKQIERIFYNMYWREDPHASWDTLKFDPVT